ncbi:uncharacterized protein LOC103059131 [Python bivittatus]|uniref:Uncharacterized protein LOC103059131 n=1 Tax=Python bivittatus TaxID=176946 RepID=A0A9F2R9H3_PYTBI|nr:uncharacterized protein LOC103059131 [Python bivittatus]
MGHTWLILFLALGTALLGSDGGEELATEAPRALCPLDDDLAASQEGELLVPRFSNCMLRCASHAYQAYRAVLATGSVKSTVSLKLNEGRQGAQDEFCWMLHLRCQRGVRLTKAFVLLNLEQPLDRSRPFPFRLLLTAPSLPHHLLQPCSRRRDTRLLNGEACGIRFDVTEPFRSAEGGRDAELCVKVVCPLEKDVCEALQFSLRCPPFLATLWRSLPRPDR